ncbi:MAG TPA: hypothetical protein VGM53_31080 [Streptosporangiaceae bacterium]|jgi:hypothetical protein
MRIPQAAERLKEAPAQALRAVLSKEAPAQQALRAVLSKEAPAQALRAVFSGVGQVLLVTERVRRRAMGDNQDRAVPAAPSAEGAHAETAAAPVVAEAAAGTVTAEPAAPAAKTAEPAASTAKTAGPEAPATRADRKTTPNKPRAGKASTSAAKSGPAKASTSKASAPKASTAKVSTAKAGAPKASTSKADTAKAAPAKTGPAQTAKAAAPKEPAAGPTGTPPIPHYSELTVASLRARMRGLDAAQLRDLISYERAHEARETVIAMFERRIAKLDAEGPAAG